MHLSAQRLLIDLHKKPPTPLKNHRDSGYGKNAPTVPKVTDWFAWDTRPENPQAFLFTVKMHLPLQRLLIDLHKTPALKTTGILVYSKTAPTDPEVIDWLVAIVIGDVVLLLPWGDANKVATLSLASDSSCRPSQQVTFPEQVTVLIKPLPSSGATSKH